MRYVLAIAFRDFRIRLSNPVLPLWDVLVPVVYLLVFGSSLERWIGAGGADSIIRGSFWAACCRW